MKNKIYKFEGEFAEDHSFALEEIQHLFPWRFSNGQGVTIIFESKSESSGSSFRLEMADNHSVKITYRKPKDAFRALGYLMGQLESGNDPEVIEEESPFETLGVMLDVSRNAVLRVETLKKLVRHLALMGINRIFLYMEDVYEIPGEPIFGYFRGAYSEAELREFDDYAAAFSIEVIPFIQTLGHLAQVLKWPKYQPLQDTASVIQVGHEETYVLIEKMIEAASRPFRSRRIHLGMDEAHGIGTGRYLSRHGYVPPFEILDRHLQRLSRICEQIGVSPMIWSDMFFRLGSKTGDYYDPDSRMPTNMAERLPDNVELVYWDYYHTDEAFYCEWIKRHRDLGREPIFAGGAWTWNRFWCALPRSFGTLQPGMAAAREAKLRDAFVTLWGDNGTECDLFSALPAIQYFAEAAYGNANTGERLSERLRGSCDISLEDWVAASKIDYYPELGDPSLAILNSGKWLLWHDPLLGFLERHIHKNLPEHYSGVAERLSEAAQKSGSRLEMPWRLARILAVKTRMHLTLRAAYRQQNIPALKKLADEDLPALETQINELFDVHRVRWEQDNKAFGWETIERRYGGLLFRLKSLRKKLEHHLEDPQYLIEELSLNTHEIYSPENIPHLVINHRRAIAPNVLN